MVLREGRGRGRLALEAGGWPWAASGPSRGHPPASPGLWLPGCWGLSVGMLTGRRLQPWPPQAWGLGLGGAVGLRLPLHTQGPLAERRVPTPSHLPGPNPAWALPHLKGGGGKAQGLCAPWWEVPWPVPARGVLWPSGGTASSSSGLSQPGVGPGSSSFSPGDNGSGSARRLGLPSHVAMATGDGWVLGLSQGPRARTAPVGPALQPQLPGAVCRPAHPVQRAPTLGLGASGASSTPAPPSAAPARVPAPEPGRLPFGVMWGGGRHWRGRLCLPAPSPRRCWDL